MSAILCWRSAEPELGDMGSTKALLRTLTMALGMWTHLRPLNHYFPHLETGIKMSSTYLFAVSVITSVILECSFLCSVLSSAKLQTHSGPPIHLIHKFKRQTEGLKCSMSYS